MKFLADVIAAEPGYFVLAMIDGDRVVKMPVIAWALERGSFQPYPVTLNGVDTNMPCIQHPEGTVKYFGARSYHSFSDWYNEKTKAR